VVEMKKRFVAAIVFLVALPITSSAGAVGRHRALSSRLVGSWTRVVSSADVKRSGSYGIPPSSVWTLRIKPNGSASAFNPSIGGIDGTIVAEGAGRVRIDIGIPAPNLYTWHASKQSLTFAKVKDSVQDRIAVFVGTWRRK
jgi:hypothetical protein